ncbi:hypothetical protein CCH79_00011420, partial [Gambusia affinis]
MDWFHCNQCFKKSGSKFAVSSCGHISCEACIKSKQCSTCGVACCYLPITDQMKPQEKVFFMDPGKLIQARMEMIAQTAIFQQKQKERVTVHFKTKSSELERRLEEVSEQGYRQLSELKRENGELKKQLSELRRENGELKKQLLELQRETAELKKPLSQRRASVSPGQFQTTGGFRSQLALPHQVNPAIEAQNLLRLLLDQEQRVMSAPESLRGGPGIEAFLSLNVTIFWHSYKNPDPWFPVPIYEWNLTSLTQTVNNSPLLLGTPL